MVKLTSTAQTGILIPGPGGQRLNTLQANLPILTQEQHDLVNKAKKYALEQSLKSILTKPPVVIASKPPPPPAQQQQKSTQRHQALVLMCRVYVGSISFEMREETIKAAFAPYGAIKSVNMSWDQVTMKHKGFAFVEYELPEAAQLALDHMNAIQLGGRQIKVGRPSNMPQAAPIIQQIQEECKEKNRIYIANVHADFSESDLVNLFEPLGKVVYCKLALPVEPDNTQHRGYGFIEFDTEAALVEALTMDKFDLAGQTLHVCRATTPAENVSINGTLASEINQNSSFEKLTTDDDVQAQLEITNREQENLSNEEEASCDNFKGSNVSEVLILKNMISPEEKFDDDLWKDIHLECVKYGHVRQLVIHVHRSTTVPNDNQSGSDDVRVFIKYKDSSEAERAREAINGRFFGGRKISVEHYDKDLFEGHVFRPTTNGTHAPDQISLYDKLFSIVFHQEQNVLS